MELLKFIGIFNGLFVLISLTLLSNSVKGFNINRKQFSKLGSLPKTSKAFSLIFLIFSINQLILLYQLITVFAQQSNIILWLPLSLASVAGIFLSFLDMDHHSTSHSVLGKIAFPLTVLGGFQFAHFSIAHGYLASGVVGILISSIMLYSILTWFKNHTVTAKYERLFFLGMLLWNILYTFPLFSLNF